MSNPNHARSRGTKLALYAQDQWTLSDLTLNLGARFESLNAWNPAQSNPVGVWVPGLDFARVDDVPNWKDVSPRLGAAYNLFGNGKTAVKASVGRYVQAEFTTLANAANLFNAIVTSATRTSNDDGDYLPQESESAGRFNGLLGQPPLEGGRLSEREDTPTSCSRGEVCIAPATPG